jgi:hypothetical protein
MPPHAAQPSLSCFGTDFTVLLSIPCSYDSSSDTDKHRRRRNAHSPSTSRLHPPFDDDGSSPTTSKRPPLVIRAIRSFTISSSFRKGKQPIRSESEGNPSAASSSAPHLPLPSSAISKLRHRNPSESSLVVGISYKQGTFFEPSLPEGDRTAAETRHSARCHGICSPLGRPFLSLPSSNPIYDLSSLQPNRHDDIPPAEPEPDS